MASGRTVPEGWSNESQASKQLRESLAEIRKVVSTDLRNLDFKSAKDVQTAVTDVSDVVQRTNIIETAIEETYVEAPAPVRDFIDKYKIPHGILLGGIVASILGSLAYIAIAFGARILSYYVGVLQPLYYTFRALETEGKDDDTLWLTYWMVYGVLNLLDETVLVPAIALFPVVYYVTKMVFLVYLVNFNGAVGIYSELLAPFFRKQDEKLELFREQFDDDDDDKEKED